MLGPGAENKQVEELGRIKQCQWGRGIVNLVKRVMGKWRQVGEKKMQMEPGGRKGRLKVEADVGGW